MHSVGRRFPAGWPPLCPCGLRRLWRTRGEEAGAAISTHTLSHFIFWLPREVLQTRHRHLLGHGRRCLRPLRLWTNAKGQHREQSAPGHHGSEHSTPF